MEVRVRGAQEHGELAQDGVVEERQPRGKGVVVRLGGGALGEVQERRVGRGAGGGHQRGGGKGLARSAGASAAASATTASMRRASRQPRRRSAAAAADAVRRRRRRGAARRRRRGGAARRPLVDRPPAANAPRPKSLAPTRNAANEWRPRYGEAATQTLPIANQKPHSHHPAISLARPLESRPQTVRRTPPGGSDWRRLPST